MGENGTEAIFTGYRALDLTDEKGSLCGKLLADLGADVIKVERPGGDSSRRIGPFWHDIPHLEKSLSWFAFNASKRGITLNLETSDGKEIFTKLVKTASFVIESFSPGYMDKLGLGYAELSRINPRIIMTSISPFGQKGPYAHFKASDLVCMAMGGLMYITGEPDRPPVRISLPQAYLHASVEAASGTVMAQYYCQRTGKGQQVDVSIQESIVHCLANARIFWVLNQRIVERGGVYIRWQSAIGAGQRIIYECQDGYITFVVYGGTVGQKSNQALIEWMKEKNAVPQFLLEEDWEAMDMPKVTQEKFDQFADAFGSFFKRFTKAEILSEFYQRGIMGYPVSTAKDILNSPQLEARDFWAEVEHPELGTTIKYPGGFVKMSETPPRIRRRAPLIGEHNEEVYREFGYSKEDLGALKQATVI
jgi:crotonobetainyl-CoA:carnitine CoA-transferase CaiB-like acyl-CoA transferase